MGIIPIAVPTFYKAFPDWFQTIFDSGISAAAVTAVLLNILFNIVGRKDAVAPIFAEGPAISVNPADQPDELDGHYNVGDIPAPQTSNPTSGQRPRH